MSALRSGECADRKILYQLRAILAQRILPKMQRGGCGRRRLLRAMWREIVTNVRAHLGVALAGIGLLITADTILLLYLGRSLFPSQDAMSLAGAFLILQEATLFGVLIYITMTAGRTSIALPVHLGYISVLVTCSLFAVLVIAIFDLLLIFDIVSIAAFWTALAIRQSTLLVLLLSVHIVGIIQRASHHQSELRRSAVEDVVRMCERVSTSAKLAGWNLGAQFDTAGERLRFSEGLRRNESLVMNVRDRLSALDGLAKTDRNVESETKARVLLNEIVLIASQTH